VCKAVNPNSCQDIFQGEIDSDLTNMLVNNPEWGYKHVA
jgi:hypothetical protein